MHPTNHTGTRITLCLQKRLYLGNLDAKRDWDHAGDDVRMQWLMLQQDHPEDYVIATGQQHSVRDFVQQAAREIGPMMREDLKEAERDVVCRREGFPVRDRNE